MARRTLCGSSVPITLTAGAAWGHLVHCFQEFSREDERRVAGFVNAIRTDIAGQIAEERDAGRRPEERTIPFAADEKNVSPALAFFNEHFRYEVGEYVLTVLAACSQKTASASVRYRTTLYESDVDAMRARAERFKIGAGIYWFQDERVIGVGLQPAT